MFFCRGRGKFVNYPGELRYAENYFFYFISFCISNRIFFNIKTFTLKATPIEKDDRSVVYRSVDKASRTHVEMVRSNVTTMAAMFEFVARKHANKKCLGTRQIKAEEDEVQHNGRVFKKVSLLILSHPN